jgi:hypothetical protein
VNSATQIRGPGELHEWKIVAKIVSHGRISNGRSRDFQKSLR